MISFSNQVKFCILLIIACETNSHQFFSLNLACINYLICTKCKQISIKRILNFVQLRAIAIELFNLREKLMFDELQSKEIVYKTFKIWHKRRPTSRTSTTAVGIATSSATMPTTRAWIPWSLLKLMMPHRAHWILITAFPEFRHRSV